MIMEGEIVLFNIYAIIDILDIKSSFTKYYSCDLCLWRASSTLFYK